MFDCVISGSRVIDPETGRDEILSVGIQEGRIAALSGNELSGSRRINGKGLVLSPGFIDIHIHEDGLDTDTEEAFRLPQRLSESALRTGYTTIVGGNCGSGNYPMGDYLQELGKAKLPINCLSLLGNMNLRTAVGLDNYTEASPFQIARMITLALAALDEGAIGISFGLQYAPGTSFAELIALAGAAAEKNKFIAVHMRHDTPPKAIETVQETIAACRISGAALQISHLAANVYGRDNLAEAVRLLAGSGLDFTADVYPYNVWATGLQSAVFDNGFGNFNFGVEDLEILSGPRAGQRCTEESFRELRVAAQDTAVACHNAMPMADVEQAYKLPFVFVASDARLSVDSGRVKGHPRAVSSPARFLREFVREKKIISLPEGIKKLSLIPAVRCALSRKGRIQEGCDADLCLFDPETITDKADFGPETCALPPTGIKCVIVAGRIMYETV